MINSLFLGVILLFAAEAQANIIDTILGKNKAVDLQVKWECPQHIYPQIRQLRDSADVRVRFVERNGVLTTQLKPNIFKVNPLSLSNVVTAVKGEAQMAVDYTDCIEVFKKSLKIALDLKKESEACRSQPKAPLCEKSTEELLVSSNEKIDQSPYLINRRSHKKLPRSLPLQSLGLEPEEMNRLLQKFRRGEPVDEKKLFSKEVLGFVSQRLGYLSQEQLERYNSSFKKYRNQLQEELCSGNSPLCEHIRLNLAQSETNIEAMAKSQIENLKNYRDPSLNALYAPENEKEATEQLKKIFETQPFDCSFMNLHFTSGGRIYSATNFPEALANNMDLFAAVADTECAAKTLQALSVTMNNRPELTKEFSERCENDWNQGCELGMKRKSIMESNLRKIWSLNFGSRGEEYISEQGGLSCAIAMSTATNPISEILKDHRKTLSCIDLKPGETKPVNFREGTPSGISGEYVLKKKKNGDHEVIVNVNVTADNHGVSRGEMHSRIKSCMNDVSPYMKGPDGRKLDFTILNPEETLKRPITERPAASKVSIQAPGTRSNSMSYKADIDCPTIAHEVLHLLGLCDEYSGDYDGYSCRAVAQVASIMSNQNEAFRQGVSKTHTCECRPGSICERVKASEDEELKKFYLQPSVYSITNYEARNKYCTYQDLPEVKWNNLADKKTAVLSQNTPTSITILAHSMSDYGWPSIGVTQFKCDCRDETNADCLKEINDMKDKIDHIEKMNLDYCPSGSVSRKEEYGEKIDKPALWSENGLRFVQKAKSPSLLHPSHYERIVGGACESKAKKYNECAVWAYRKKEQTNNCAGRPEHCANGKEFLGVEK